MVELYYFVCCIYVYLPSVLWCCWLGGRKGIRPVTNWVVWCWHGYLCGARCRLAYGPADATATHCLLLQWNPDWFLPFLYRLTRVVLEKGPLNGCVCVCVSVYWFINLRCLFCETWWSHVHACSIDTIFLSFVVNFGDWRWRASDPVSSGKWSLS